MHAAYTLGRMYKLYAGRAATPCRPALVLDCAAMAHRPEETLDPQDWSATRALGQRMMEDALAYLEGVRERKVWTPIPAETRAFLAAEAEAPPSGPTAPEAVYETFRREILPQTMGNIHPRFWGWVIGTGSACREM